MRFNIPRNNPKTIIISVAMACIAVATCFVFTEARFSESGLEVESTLVVSDLTEAQPVTQGTTLSTVAPTIEQSTQPTVGSENSAVSNEASDASAVAAVATVPTESATAATLPTETETASVETATLPQETTTKAKAKPKKDSTDWSVTVVNAENSFDKSYKPRLKYMKKYDTYVDERIYPELLELLNAAKKDGIHLHINYAYRSAEQQKKIYNNRVNKYIREGYSKKAAVKMTRKTVLPAGKSEHQTGLAIDFTAAKGKGNSVEQIQAWLNNKAYLYGFTLRYPADKTEITGIGYEPWHYRYVGIKAAKVMKEQKICLEEYVKKQK